VIGWPVQHSRSPAIHTAAALHTGADLSYVSFPVEPGRAAEAAAAMRTLGIRGLSVTMPHKEDVLEALDELTPTAVRLGAVNCITNTDGHLVGDNTDGEGFLLGYEHDSGRSVSGRSVVVHGAGGAARAIVLACANAGAATVTVINRTHDRASEAALLAGEVGAANDPAAMASADLVVNATPCGMADTPQAHDVPFDIEDTASHVDVVDIVYNPRITPLIAATRQADRSAFGGLSMLAGQAAAQFQSWTGHRPSLDVLVAAATGE
jgi:shikimate dehydrogenase